MKYAVTRTIKPARGARVNLARIRFFPVLAEGGFGRQDRCAAPAGEPSGQVRQAVPSSLARERYHPYPGRTYLQA